MEEEIIFGENIQKQKINEIADNLTIRNGWDYNHRKAIEELLELAEVLMKKVNKKGGKKEPQDQEIVDEIGDVRFRLRVLSRIYGKKKVDAREVYKVSQFDSYIKEDKYKHI